MELTGNIIRQGISEPEGFSVDYTITYNGEGKVIRVEAAIKRKQVDGQQMHTGYASYTVEPYRYTFQLTGSASTVERCMLIDDFESTLKGLAVQE